MIEHNTRDFKYSLLDLGRVLLAGIVGLVGLAYLAFGAFDAVTNGPNFGDVMLALFGSGVQIGGLAYIFKIIYDNQ